MKWLADKLAPVDLDTDCTYYVLQLQSSVTANQTLFVILSMIWLGVVLIHVQKIHS